MTQRRTETLDVVGFGKLLFDRVHNRHLRSRNNLQVVPWSRLFFETIYFQK